MPLLEGQSTFERSLATYTAPELISPHMEVDSPVEAIAHLAMRMQLAGFAPDGGAVAMAALEREERCSTAMDFGFAMPHARLDSVSGPCLAIGLCPRPLRWGDRNVHGVILLAVPEAGAMDYLRLVGGIARFSSKADCVRKLRQGRDAGEIMDLLATFPLAPGS